MTQHTPGPWTVRTAGGTTYGCFQINPFALEERAYLKKQPNAITLRGQKLQFERQANARLIAAAPDLLAALEAVAKKIDKASGLPNFTVREVDKLEAVIAKARGQS